MFFHLNKKELYTSISMQEAKNLLVKDPSIRLIDVRSSDEYRQGHIPGSMNIPLDQISGITRVVPDKDSRLFVHCLSGARSQRACAWLAKLGYSDVTNIGGIAQWTGEVVRTANR